MSFGLFWTNNFFLYKFFSFQIPKILKLKCVSGYPEQMTFFVKKIWTNFFYENLKILELKCFSVESEQKFKKKIKTKIILSIYLS